MSIQVNGTKIKLTNDFIYRELDIEKGPVTTRYQIRPSYAASWLPIFAFEPGSPFEAAIVVDGKEYEVSSWEERGDWTRQGAFQVAAVDIKETELGDALILRCTGRNSGASPVEIKICYELAAKLPVLIKHVEIKNVSDRPLTVENVTIDILKDLRLGCELRVFSDYYWGFKNEDEYYKTFSRIEFPQKIMLELAPDESFKSFRCFQVSTPGDDETAAVLTHRVIKKVAPWITQMHLAQLVNGCDSYEELLAVADRAHENGIEYIELFYGQLFTNVGDYLPRPDLFPGGKDDLKRLVAYFHKKNLLLVPYCSTTIAYRDSKVCQAHPDWQYLGPDNMRYEPGVFGNMCYQSPWGDYIKGQLTNLISEYGFDGLGLDGTYHGLTCLEKGHKHRSPEAVPFMNWAWERDFFGEMQGQGLYLTAPCTEEGLLLGINKRPGGYTEEDYAVMGGMPLVSTFRSRLYDARYKLPSCATWSFCAIDEYHDHGIEASEGNTASYNHALGGTLGYGHSGNFYGRELYIGPNTEKVFKGWVDFFRKYRATLAGEMIHLARPNGSDPDAVMHISPAANPPALLVIFNPVDVQAKISLEIPLRDAGFAGGSTAVVEDYGLLKLDSRASGIITIELAPDEIKVLEVNHP